MRRTTRFINLITATSFILMSYGCATSQKMAAEDKARITSIQINDSVEKGQAFLLPPGGASVGLMFGAVGGAVSAGSIANAQEAFTAYLATNSISIERIVREEITNAIRDSGKFSITATPDTSAPSIKIAVQQYGFGVTHLLSSNVVPVLHIKCDMIDGNGKIIWHASDRMLPSIASPMVALPWDQLTSDPKQIEEQLRKAAKFLAEKLIKEL